MGYEYTGTGLLDVIMGFYYRYIMNTPGLMIYISLALDWYLFL